MINVVCVADGQPGFAEMACVMVKSLIVNHATPEPLRVTVIDGGIPSHLVRELKSYERPDVSMYFIPFEKDTVERSGIDYQKLKMHSKPHHSDDNRIMLSAFSRLFMPKILPKEMKRVIYIDVDMLVLDDISKIWNLDLDGHEFGAVPDMRCSIEESIINYKELGLDPKEPYYNSGLFLIDLKNRETIFRRFVKVLNDNWDYLMSWDQYVINVVYHQRCKMMDQRWNIWPCNTVSDNHWNIVRDIENPGIIHFVTQYKPVFERFAEKNDANYEIQLHRVSFQNAFLRYLDMTNIRLPWREPGQMVTLSDAQPPDDVYAVYGCHYRGDDFYYGRNGEKVDHKKAFHLWLEGAELGNMQCMKNVAWAYRDGIGTTKDKNKAKKWEKKAKGQKPARSWPISRLLKKMTQIIRFSLIVWTLKICSYHIWT